MIRHATFSDIPVCVEIIRQAHEQSGNYRGEFSPDKAGEGLSIRVMNPYSLILLNEKQDGLLIGTANDSPYSDSLRVANEFLYAESEGLALIRDYIKWAKRFGPSTEINFYTSFGGEKGEKAARILGRLGFSEVGKQMRIL